MVSTVMRPHFFQQRIASLAVSPYPENAKMKKQFGYADTRHIPYVVIAGENEMNENKVTLKNMNSGEQQLVSKEQLLAIIKQ